MRIFSTILFILFITQDDITAQDAPICTPNPTVGPSLTCGVENSNFANASFATISLAAGQTYTIEVCPNTNWDVVIDLRYSSGDFIESSDILGLNGCETIAFTAIISTTLQIHLHRYIGGNSCNSNNSFIASVTVTCEETQVDCGQCPTTACAIDTYETFSVMPSALCAVGSITYNVPIQPAASGDDTETPRVCQTFTNPVYNNGSTGGYICGRSLLSATTGGVCGFGLANLTLFDNSCTEIPPTTTANLLPNAQGAAYNAWNGSVVVGGAEYTMCFEYVNLVDNGSGDCQATAICPGIYFAPAPLPIKLSYLNAEDIGKSNIITWQTVSEINNNYQAIQKSSNGVNNWIELGRVDSKGSSQRGSTYLMKDNSPFPRTYYRLQSVDLDGFIEYSNIVSVSKRTSLLSLSSVTPNPNQGLFNVEFSGSLSYSQEKTIKLFDTQGNLIESRIINDSNNELYQSFDLSSNPNGVYFMQLLTDDQVETIRIFKF